MKMKAAIIPLLVVAIATPPPNYASAQCLVGDFLYDEGDSIGNVGWECINETSYDATAAACGPDGEVIETDAELSCDSAAPHCVQCGSRGRGAALCLSSPDVGDADRDCGEDDEDFLPRSTPSPAAVATTTTTTMTMTMTMTMTDEFDQCDNDQDASVWDLGGGQAGRPAQMLFCTQEFVDDGGSTCLADSDCVEACFREEFGYTAACSVCFGAMPLCALAEGCAFICFADNQSVECEECNAACVNRMNECTGLPDVSGAAPAASPGPNGAATASPNYVETAAPNYDETARPSFQNFSSPDAKQTAPSPASNATTTAPSSLISNNSTGGDEAETSPSPTDEPTMMPSHVMTPAPSTQPANPPTSAPTTGAAIAPPGGSGPRIVNCETKSASHKVGFVGTLMAIYLMAAALA